MKAMHSKAILIVILLSALVSGALVFDGILHRHAATGLAAASSDDTTAASADTSNADTSTSTESDESTEPDQNGSSDDGSTTEFDGDAVPVDAAPAGSAWPLVIPAGTRVTVRLGEALGSEISQSNQRFSATLARNIVVGGQTVIPAGATVTGRVVFAKPAGTLSGAKLRIRLTSINADNGNLLIATSIRNFGHKVKARKKVGKFMRGLISEAISESPTVGVGLYVAKSFANRKRAAHDGMGVFLAQQSVYSFTLERSIRIG